MDFKNWKIFSQKRLGWRDFTYEVSHTSFNAWTFFQDDLPRPKSPFFAVFNEIEPIFLKFLLEFH